MIALFTVAEGTEQTKSQEDDKKNKGSEERLQSFLWLSFSFQYLLNT